MSQRTVAGIRSYISGFRLLSGLLTKKTASISRSVYRRMSENLSKVKYLKQDEAIAVDQELFNEYAFSVDQLMELAGLSCAHAVACTYPVGNVLVVVGPGNNGGDGFVCARHLKLFGYSPSVVYPKPSKSDLMNRLLTQVTKMSIPVFDGSSLKETDVSKEYTVIVDAAFGFSFKPPLRSPFDKILSVVGKSGLPIVSVDIPSGWDVENGPGDDKSALSPEVLVSLTAPKLCAKYFKGKVHYLGGRFIPQSLAEKYELNLPHYSGTDCLLKL